MTYGIDRLTELFSEHLDLEDIGNALMCEGLVPLMTGEEIRDEWVSGGRV